MVVVGGIYLAAQPRFYRQGILLLVPRNSRAAAAAVLDETAGALKLWLLGQLAIMVLVGTLTGLGAWLIGLPSALALGLLAGLLEFIPFLGPILTAVRRCCSVCRSVHRRRSGRCSCWFSSSSSKAMS